MFSNFFFMVVCKNNNNTILLMFKLPVLNFYFFLNTSLVYKSGLPTLKSYMFRIWLFDMAETTHHKLPNVKNCTYHESKSHQRYITIGVWRRNTTV